jgi:hypothetical protein
MERLIKASGICALVSAFAIGVVLTVSRAVNRIGGKLLHCKT